MSVKKTVIGVGMALALFAGAGRGQTCDVFVSVSDTTLYPGDQAGRWLTVTMRNPNVKIGGWKVGLIISNPSVINFPFTTVDTTPPFLDTIVVCFGGPCRDTVITICPDTCFVFHSEVITAGTLSEGAAKVVGTRQSEIVNEVTVQVRDGAHQGPVVQPSSAERVLFRVPLDIFPILDSVSLSERQVQISVDPTFTSFSDSTGNISYTVFDTLNTLCLANGIVFVPFSIKGDVNFDGLLTSSDVVRLSNFTFLGLNPPLPSVSVGDVNCDGIFTSADVVLEINRVFLGTPFPCS